MSMDCDTRLSMMALRNNTHHQPRRRSRVRRISVAAATTMATLALTLFTRGV